MEMYDPKKSKSYLRQMISFLLTAEFVLIILAVLALVNYIAFASGCVWAIVCIVFSDVTLVLMILDIITSHKDYED